MIFSKLFLLILAMISMNNPIEVTNIEKSQSRFNYINENTYLYVKSDSIINNGKGYPQIIQFSLLTDKLSVVFDSKVLFKNETIRRDVFITKYFILNDVKILIFLKEYTFDKFNVPKSKQYAIIFDQEQNEFELIDKLESAYFIRQYLQNSQYFIYDTDRNDNFFMILNIQSMVIKRISLPSEYKIRNLEEKPIIFGRNENEVVFGNKTNDINTEYIFYNYIDKNIVHKIQTSLYFHAIKISPKGRYLILFHFTNGLYCYDLKKDKLSFIIENINKNHPSRILFHSWIQNNEKFLYSQESTLFEYDLRKL